MKVAVVTPYYAESTEVLRRCHASVLAQNHQCAHIMVADGLPNQAVTGWAADHIVLPRSHGDIGSTPRLVGAFHAIGLGFDAVAFLDADNSYRPDHIASLVELHQRTGAGFVCSSRELMSLDGRSLGPCPLTDPGSFIDTSCMMFTRDCFHLLPQWTLMPSYGHVIGDRIMLAHVHRSGVSLAFNPGCTVLYTCAKEGLYRAVGEPIPDGVAPRPDYESAMAKWIADGNPPLPGRRTPRGWRMFLQNGWAALRHRGRSGERSA